MSNNINTAGSNSSGSEACSIRGATGSHAPISSAWKLALQTTKRHKKRAFAMGTTLMIGVLTITLTVATGEGARKDVERSFRSMLGAFDVLMLMPGKASQRGAPHDTGVESLKAEDVQTVFTSVPNIRDASMAQASYNIDVSGNGEAGVASVWGVTPNWTALRGNEIAAGSTFSDEEAESMARVALVGSEIAKKYLIAGDPIGQEIRIKDNTFRVVGVLAAQGAGPGGANMDNIVYIPLQTGQRRFFNRDYLDFASFKLIDPAKWEETQDAIDSAWLVVQPRIRTAIDSVQVQILNESRSTKTRLICIAVSDPENLSSCA